jgi:chemotaxis protein MotB
MSVAQGDKSAQLWMVPYSDLMTCMVILFLALYGSSFNMKKSDYEQAMAKLQQEMGDKNAKAKVAEMEATKQVEEDLKKQIAEGSLGVEVTTTRIKLTFAAPILFDSGSAALKPSAAEILRPVTESMLKMKNSVIVEGHTDASRMLGKKFASNRELSLMRAFSVIDFLIKSGYPPDRITAFGYGEYRPAAPNDTEENRARNRRIEITIMRQEQLQENKG